jgi:outer membrane protein OmpA-like peptidoglycan-associated protein
VRATACRTLPFAVQKVNFRVWRQPWVVVRKGQGVKRGWILSLGWLIWAGCVALLLPPRFRTLERDLHDTVRQHLTETGFDDIDVAVDGQSAQVRWRGLASPSTDAATLHGDLERAAAEAASARPDDWPFPHTRDWSDWVTAPIVLATADQTSVPNLAPPGPVIGTETDPRLAAEASESSASVASASLASASLASTLASASEAAPAAVAVSASASASVAASCTDKVTAAISGRRLHFVSSSAQLTSDSDAVLDSVYKVVRSCPAGLRLEIDGYTDNVGPDKANLTLSFERARAAAAALVKRGLPQDMVNAHGFGEQSPVASNANDAGRAANRRVVFILRPA